MLGHSGIGTEVCLSTAEDNFDELVAWVIQLVQKMLVLKSQNVAVELVVDHIDNQESRRDHLLQRTDNDSLPVSLSYIELLVSGLEEYVLKHGIFVEEKFQTCSTRRDDLKVGSGQASTAENSKGTGQTVEVIIVIATMASQPCCWRANSSTTQVLYFQDFSLSAISQPSINALVNVDWQNYGLRLTGNFVDDDHHAVLKWENMALFSHIDIAIHNYSKITIPQARQETPAIRSLIKKAVKCALDDLKAKYTGFFLSSHAFKVREYAPDLSKSIAGLILSSNDPDFQNECGALLGLEADDAGFKERIETCIQKKIIGVLEMNDRKPKGERDNGTSLFECESLAGEGCLDDGDDAEAEEWSALDL
ncbi:type 2 DNA topoisomerase 6 subunit B-like isoform X1 [Iris pallida]|uniref:Type 2 DNA topoisomerase 6 subunit B-like isoform X1 n=1 Tax=Iris pallida TaxID=29817 RepID=A0AAX6E7G1_IRIPA|nr:type 2 DNA topoisomerase 6 subunit B-like isoform X1 [Iris pallida]